MKNKKKLTEEEIQRMRIVARILASAAIKIAYEKGLIESDSLPHSTEIGEVPKYAKKL